jgi:hypothetical protein
LLVIRSASVLPVQPWLPSRSLQAPDPVVISADN